VKGKRDYEMVKNCLYLVFFGVLFAIILGLAIGGICYYYEGRIQSDNAERRELKITNQRITDGIDRLVRYSRGRDRLIEQLQTENTELNGTIKGLRKDNIRLEAIGDAIKEGTGRATEKLDGIKRTVEEIDRLLRTAGERKED
jgi:uncharacterized protein HemX